VLPRLDHGAGLLELGVDLGDLPGGLVAELVGVVELLGHLVELDQHGGHEVSDQT